MVVGDGRDFGEDLRRGIAAADHHDALPAERVGPAVGHGVDLGAAEGVRSGVAGPVRSAPRAGRADHGAGPPDPAAGSDLKVVGPGVDGVDVDVAPHGQVVPGFIGGEVVADVAGGRKGLAGLVGHPPAGQWAVSGWGEQP